MGCWMTAVFCVSLIFSAFLNVEAKLNLFLNQREVRRLLGEFLLLLFKSFDLTIISMLGS